MLPSCASRALVATCPVLRTSVLSWFGGLHTALHSSLFHRLFAVGDLGKSKSNRKHCCDSDELIRLLRWMVLFSVVNLSFDAFKGVISVVSQQIGLYDEAIGGGYNSSTASDTAVLASLFIF